MALAANQLIASGGGMALAQQGEIAHVAMPIAGMLSDLPPRSWRVSSASCAI
jgi:adenine deaminase